MPTEPEPNAAMVAAIQAQSIARATAEPLVGNAIPAAMAEYVQSPTRSAHLQKIVGKLNADGRTFDAKDPSRQAS